MSFEEIVEGLDLGQAYICPAYHIYLFGLTPGPEVVHISFYL